MLSLVLAAAVAASASAAPPAGHAGHADDPVVCRVEPIPGSRITHRVCLRASQAAQMRRDARWLLDRAQAGSQAPNMATLVQMGPAGTR